MQKISIITVCLLVCYQLAYAQVEGIRDITPMSPEAANLGKYAMQPPNYSNGQASWSLPLYTIEENGLSYPLSLFYSYSGLKLNEEAPYVGLGWGLSEASVTRLIKHLPDDNPNTHKKFEEMDYRNLVPETGQGWQDPPNAVQGSDYTSYNLTANRILRSIYDGKPDLYVYNVGGYSGRFLWLDDEPIHLTATDVLVERAGNGNFYITTPQGIKYTLGSYETSAVWNEDSFANYTMDHHSPECGDMAGYTTFQGQSNKVAWKVTKIENLANSSYINFTYSGYGISKTYGGKNYFESMSFWSSTDPSKDPNKYWEYSWRGSSERFSASQQIFPSTIESNSIKIVFTTLNRTDLAGAKAINEIKIYHKSNLATPVKVIKLNYGYFGGIQEETTWLKLAGVDFLGGSEIRSYDFSYLDESLAAGNKGSFSIDHWGYYNGAANVSLVPQTQYVSQTWSIPNGPFSVLSQTGLGNFAWANRNPSYAAAKRYALQKITYPTKGYTQFNYESAGGRGIRVASIDDYDGSSTVSKFYDYYPDNPIPTPQYQETTYWGDVCTTSGTSYQQEKYYNISGQTRQYLDWHDLNTNFYSKVTELIGDASGTGGKTEYHFIRDAYTFEAHQTEIKHFEYGNPNPVALTKNNYTIKDMDVIEYWGDPVIYELHNFIHASISPPQTICVSCARDPDGNLYGGYYILSDVGSSVYELRPRWYKLTSTEEYSYLDDGTVNKVTNYFYKVDGNGNPLLTLPKGKTMIGSNGVGQSVEFYYPGDVDPDNSPTKLGVAQMYNSANSNYKHMIGVVAKKREKDGSQLQSYTTNFYSYNSTYDRVDLDRTELHAGGVSDKTDVYYDYYTSGKLKSIQKGNDVKTSYLWTYDQSMVLAVATNAEVNEIAYTSFENGNAEGGWNFGNSTSSSIFKTGKKSHHHNSYDMTKSGLPAGKYVVSFWARQSSTSNPNVAITNVSPAISVNTSTWTYYEREVTLGSSITVNPTNVYIDELRLFPADAQMVTFTYDPLVGITSKSELNGKTTIFQYDDQDRLEQIRDEQGNLLQEIKYHFKP